MKQIINRCSKRNFIFSSVYHNIYYVYYVNNVRYKHNEHNVNNVVTYILPVFMQR